MLIETIGNWLTEQKEKLSEEYDEKPVRSCIKAALLGVASGILDGGLILGTLLFMCSLFVKGNVDEGEE
jgi:hypothetical protein